MGLLASPVALPAATVSAVQYMGVFGRRITHAPIMPFGKGTGNHLKTCEHNQDTEKSIRKENVQHSLYWNSICMHFLSI